MRQRSLAAAVGGVVSAMVVGAVALSALPSAAAHTPPGMAQPRARTVAHHVRGSTVAGPFQVTDFACTGAPQTYVVPPGAATVNVRLAGGDGGSGGTNFGGLA